MTSWRFIFSLFGFLQNGVVQGLVRHQLLPPEKFFLEGLELLGHLRSHSAVLLTPAVAHLRSDSQKLANFRNLLSLARLDIGSTKSRNNLVHTVTPVSHRKEFFPGDARLRFSHKHGCFS